MSKRTILIDLDGVLNTYTGNYQEDFIPPMREGVREFLSALVDKYELKLFTTRPTPLAKKWLEENNLDGYFADVTNTKVPAWLIIDDRCTPFKGDYSETLEKIAEFQPWYRS